MLLSLLALTVAAASPTSVAGPRFDAIAFFAGRTEGLGRIKIALGRTRPLFVHGRGSVGADGMFVLRQTVEQAGKPARDRAWRLRRIGGDGYAGTLTDATGPVSGETIGNRLHLAYRSKGGIAIEQWLTLAPDGRSAHNVLTARKLGLVVARIDETIRKVD